MVELRGERKFKTTHFPSGVTVAELKSIILNLPDTDQWGDACEVWVSCEAGRSCQAFVVSPLNFRKSDDGSNSWSDVLIGA